MTIEEFNALQDKMREAVLEPCGMDRFRMKFYMSRATLIDLTMGFKEQEYKREWEARQDQAKWERDVLVLANKSVTSEKPKLDPFHLNRLSLMDTDLIAQFMGRPIVQDDTIPYMEFKLLKDD